MKLPQAVCHILSSLNNCGFEAYTVGGCVRDLIMGKSPHDWDITTSATPDQVQKVFSGYSVIPTGIKHGTVTVILDKIPFEITTFRIDGSYSDSRHPEDVTFSTNLIEDLKRRDFTINAIAYHPQTGIVDPFDGQEDIQNKIIRTVGNPAQRFSEDALRIMRAIRFSAVLGFEINSETADSLDTHKHLLENIAEERIGDELNKLLCSGNAAAALNKYFAVLSPRLFGSCPTFPFDISVFNSINLVPCQLSLRLAAFIAGASHIFDADTVCLGKSFFSHLKYDNKTRRKTTVLLSNLHRKITPDRISIRHIIRDIGADAVQDIIKLKSALQSDNLSLLESSQNILSAILQDGDCCHLNDLAINGIDLVSEFNLNGAGIGNALNTLLDAVIEDKCPNTRSSLIKYLKSVI